MSRVSCRSAKRLNKVHEPARSGRQSSQAVIFAVARLHPSSPIAATPCVNPQSPHSAREDCFFFFSSYKLHMACRNTAAVARRAMWISLQVVLGGSFLLTLKFLMFAHQHAYFGLSSLSSQDLWFAPPPLGSAEMEKQIPDPVGLRENVTTQTPLTVESVASTNDSTKKADAETGNIIPQTPTEKTQPIETSETTLDAEKTTSKTDETVDKKKPLNIVILYPDDMRHDSLSVAGNPVVKTPFLDQLAAEGIRFTYNCVTTSICWVSRATWFTGQYMSRHDSPKVRNPNFYQRWNASYPAILQKAGYYTGHVGKWQYADYDFVKAHYNFTSLVEGYHWGRVKGKRTHITDINKDAGIQFLQERPKDAPFMLGVAFYAPKAVGEGSQQYNPKNETFERYVNATIPIPPNTFDKLPEFLKSEKLDARKRYFQRFGTPELYQRMMKEYFAMIEDVDSACKAIYDELDKQGILNETMIIFTTDNGYFHGEHGFAGKWFPYAESIRVPLIIRDPRIPHDKINTTDDSFTLNIDLAETILGAANLAPDPRMQGRDIADLYLRNATNWRTQFFYEHPSLAIRVLPSSTALVRKDMKYMRFDQYRQELLFNLTADPLEADNLINETSYANVLEEMRKTHNELQKAAK